MYMGLSYLPWDTHANPTLFFRHTMIDHQFHIFIIFYVPYLNLSHIVPFILQLLLGLDLHIE